VLIGGHSLPGPPISREATASRFHLGKLRRDLDQLRDGAVQETVDVGEAAAAQSGKGERGREGDFGEFAELPQLVQERVDRVDDVGEVMDSVGAVRLEELVSWVGSVLAPWRSPG
jgi:hypothetical protein